MNTKAIHKLWTASEYFYVFESIEKIFDFSFTITYSRWAKMMMEQKYILLKSEMRTFLWQAGIVVAARTIEWWERCCIHPKTTLIIYFFCQAFCKLVHHFQFTIHVYTFIVKQCEKICTVLAKIKGVLYENCIHKYIIKLIVCMSCEFVCFGLSIVGFLVYLPTKATHSGTCSILFIYLIRGYALLWRIILKLWEILVPNFEHFYQMFKFSNFEYQDIKIKPCTRRTLSFNLLSMF